MQENVMQNPTELKNQQPDVPKKSKKEKKPVPKGKKMSLIWMLVCIVASVVVWIIQRFVVDPANGVEYEGISDAIGGEVFPVSEGYGSIGRIQITDTMTSVWITVGILLIFALIFRFVIFPRFKTVPTGFQAFIEWIVTCFDNMAKENVHGYAPTLGPYAFATAAFICIGTLTETLGIRPPNTDINVCIALALMTFVTIHLYGVKKKKARYLGKYKIGITVITDVAVPVSMTFRMYGSILSGFLMMALITHIIPPLTPVLPSFFYILFTLFHALIQSYVFGVLSLSFVAEAIE